jgi:hypothetical protein
MRIYMPRDGRSPNEKSESSAMLVISISFKRRKLEQVNEFSMDATWQHGKREEES